MTANVLGVLSGRDFPDQSLEAWAKSADHVIAADSAGDRLLRIGIVPDIVIGDMDSSKTDWSTVDTQVIRDPSQELSDCDKLLALAGARRITLAGVEGDRLDHVLSTLSSVLRCPSQVRILLRRGIAFTLKAHCRALLPTEADQRFSLIPLSESRVTLTNAEWTLEDEKLALESRVSISNRAKGPTEITVSSGAVLTIIELESTPIPDWGEPLWPVDQSP